MWDKLNRVKYELLKLGDGYIGLPRWYSGKESACQCRRHKRLGFNL